MEIRKSDVIIIGSGLAGLLAAKLLSEYKNVLLITKGALNNSNSILAQGGIAASVDKNDHWQNHYMDTIEAGNFHNVEASTELLVKFAPDMIQQLIDFGVQFDLTPQKSLALGREGGHHHQRIVHAGGDSTGKKVVEQLISIIKNQILISEEEVVLDLLIHQEQCIGVISKDEKGELYLNLAAQTILATGGIGNLYPITSNDPTITGDGLAMAYRAGAELVDLEFIQFHPTMLVKNNTFQGLISEAVRGEGAKLVNEKREYLMENIHPLKDLAPRDIVTRRIFSALQKGEKVFLDISMIQNFRQRFPTITNLCEKAGIPIDQGKLPVAPGAHFIMGGIKTDLNGQTTIPGLYAIGETAFTGVHGANRLASNSLLEGLVFANRASRHILRNQRTQPAIVQPNFISPPLSLPSIQEIQQVMMDYVGIHRDESGLLYAKEWLESFLPNIPSKMVLNLEQSTAETLNMLTAGWLITTSALQRRESRGGHFRTDYPAQDDQNWLKRYITRRRNTDESNQIKHTSAAVIH